MFDYTAEVKFYDEKFLSAGLLQNDVSTPYRELNI
ncbi:hypothetical protein SAMN05421852_105144 [Thermoflavimicrobium dichotomicum]|uniref:Uncharacterized protein n=1 Tax=Thermoflavimicrobium dichotomicum TaxID=46223 RepID=A0A1I3P9F0_9BACL|nr:hypothetical protein SAMN05421852_105144 [Thermoflavimicrobium dichotomicum]